MDDFIEVIKSIQMVQGTASTLVLQGAILDLSARLDAAEKRIEQIDREAMIRQHLENALAKPSPDKQEMVKRYWGLILHAIRFGLTNKDIEDRIRAELSDFYEEVRNEIPR